MALEMDIGDLGLFLQQEFPQVAEDFSVDHLDDTSIRVRLKVTDRHLRPGSTVSGPSMFALADCAMYLAVLSRIGPKALAVTTNCAIDFMRKPEAGRDVLCDARLLKLGRVLAVGDAMLFSEGHEDRVVARASLTYSIPPIAAG
ncbi:uncharacterized protein (TIGR00369 family) [Aliiruegeria haliotis]|uniref:Uncharacterized protein (TIGR00369 family) n=1 Tax=Aliiruegeria haliotis TaxID=1280846 RepID=A0A2T0S001_9RHOB|nr:PaaI family thioesterase [Aliiruegeria haliotis]PRY26757.1 uncharacterized protein (TIGR00369 family) [Aliiruegeria haliotis]